MAEKLFNGESDQLCRMAIQQALKGDPIALRLCLERILPPMKSRPLRFKLPELRTISDAQDALAAIIAGAANGTILCDEAVALSGIVNSFLKSVEIADLETRLVALEQVSAEERSMVRFDA